MKVSKRSLALLAAGVTILAALALVSSCTFLDGPDQTLITYYGGSDPKGDYIEIQINREEAQVRHINHTTGEDSGWLSYTPETAMASGFTILNRVVTDPTRFVLFAEFPNAACVYQPFDSLPGPDPVAVGNPVYVVYREQVGKSAYYGKAFNWMRFKINDLNESDMSTGFAGMDSSDHQGIFYGANYSHRRELENGGYNGSGIEDINAGDALQVDAFAYDSDLVSNIMWKTNPGDMDWAIVMTGTASGTNILDFGINEGGGMGLAFPQTTSSSFISTYAGTYFTIFYEYNGQTAFAKDDPLKIVVTSTGDLQAFAYDGGTADPGSALFNAPLQPIATFAGGPNGEPVRTTYQTVSGNASALSPAVQQAHTCNGGFIAQSGAITCVVMVDPAGRYLGFTLFEDPGTDGDGDVTDDFIIRFGMGIKDSGYADP